MRGLRAGLGRGERVKIADQCACMNEAPITADLGAVFNARCTDPGGGMLWCSGAARVRVVRRVGMVRADVARVRCRCAARWRLMRRVMRRGAVALGGKKEPTAGCMGRDAKRA